MFRAGYGLLDVGPEMSVSSRRVYIILGFWIFKRDSVHSIVRTASFGANRFCFNRGQVYGLSFSADRFSVFCNRPGGQRSIETGKLPGHQLQIVSEIDGQLSERRILRSQTVSGISPVFVTRCGTIMAGGTGLLIMAMSSRPAMMLCGIRNICILEPG